MLDCVLTSLAVKVASLDRTLTRPQATYQRVGLRLHCTLVTEVEASVSGFTASLWSVRPRSPAWTLKARAGDFASDYRGRLRSSRPSTNAPKESSAAALTLPDKTKVSGSMPPSEYDVVRRPSRHIARPENLPISPLDFPPFGLGTLQPWGVMDVFSK
ncbi:unnamed protein product [Caenorhabditis auriculariae]|uniref:Uncharacterized protein n=1 Tax=Caenorhabditis auriculariae TaxID=2777116 RepID=A0A8S1H378_9PELO|nr:unnamed protein product [Caenorhabditis auriculariae]